MINHNEFMKKALYYYFLAQSHVLNVNILIIWPNEKYILIYCFYVDIIVHSLKIILTKIIQLFLT